MPFGVLMDYNNEKEKLEQELKFLKESFEAEVITKEEYENGKERIEKKLKEGTNNKEDNNNEKERIKLTVIQNEHEHIHSEAIEKIEEKELTQKPVPEEPKIYQNQKKKDKFLVYTLVFIVLLAIVASIFSILHNSKATKNSNSQERKTMDIVTKKTSVIVVSDKEYCFNCDTQRVLGILEQWFGPLDVKKIDFGTVQGKEFTKKVDARLIPVYIFDENITTNPRFEEFNRAFIKKNSTYILSEDASASTFYIKREFIPNRIDLFIISGDNASLKSENNLKQFLEAFKGIKFEKHYPDETLTQELGIKTFPTFLVSNIVKFSGVQTAESIKNNFCKLNKLGECEKSLTKSLI